MYFFSSHCCSVRKPNRTKRCPLCLFLSSQLDENYVNYFHARTLPKNSNLKVMELSSTVNTNDFYRNVQQHYTTVQCCVWGGRCIARPHSCRDKTAMFLKVLAPAFNTEQYCNFPSLLGALATLRKANNSFVMSAGPSVRPNGTNISAPTERVLI